MNRSRAAAVGRARVGVGGAVLLLLALVAALVLGAAAPASAHATLVTTDPAEGAVLEAAPETVTLTFSEAVGGVPDGVQVFDAQGGSIASSSAASGPGLTVTLDEEVGDGTLVVVWRVVSEDGHPISGSLSFSVGAPSAIVETPPGGAGADGSNPPWVLSLFRWLGYVALLVAVGVIGFVVVLLPRTNLADRSRGWLVRTARVGAVATAVAWLIGLPLTAMYLLGGDTGSLTRGSTWAILSTTEYAVTTVVVLGVGLGAVLLGAGLPDAVRGRVALVAVVVAACAPALVGHTRAESPEWLVVGADMLHLLAGSVWLGGLLALALTLVDLAERGTLGAEVLARFSGIAAGVLAALVITGSFLAWRIIGSVGALFDTGYGQLLLVKIVAALVAVAIAAWNRWRLLPAMQQTARRKERRAGARVVARATAAEAGVLVVVLLLTGFLVDRSPESEQTAVPTSARVGPLEVQTAELGDLTVRATMSPQLTGPNTFTIELLDAGGQPGEGVEPPVVSLASGDVDLGALPLIYYSPGNFSADAVVPTPGTWTLQVSLRLTEFENPVATLEFEVEAP
ncbi:copper resistance CopC/CopD family protein [Nocardioides dongxiaopingii]|uniref:copper resistance CopC/CopD family protein n=1 Tax=Nocardioides sp. S-1144 TaxID=2582905 RepID=UPI0021CB6340|nr:copper resistance protein CopC/CopD [Nocardioides sp. S-1144]